MPEPKDDESYDDWMDRCIPYVIDEEGLDQGHAIAKCNGIWEQEKNSMSENIERRHVPADQVEVREENDHMVIEGHAALFNSETEIMGAFREKIAPGAFRESIESDDIRALFNHDMNHVLGRNKSGTLDLTEDGDGLRDKIDLPDNSVGRNVAESVRRGDVTGQSFSFRAEEESWERNDEGLDLRTIEKATLFDVGPVTFPAYQDTDVSTAKRRYEEWRSKRQEPTEPEPDHSDEDAQRERELALKKKRIEMDA